jgi:hypothetical protein
MPLRRLGYGVSVSHRMMPSNITSVSNGSVSALVLCLRSESRNLFRQSNLALHLRKWVWSSTGCWHDWHSLGYSVALYLATIFPVASSPQTDQTKKMTPQTDRRRPQRIVPQKTTLQMDCATPNRSYGKSGSHHKRRCPHKKNYFGASHGTS